MLNDFDELAPAYTETDAKPDKLYSILPTVLQLAGEIKDKTILDLGCGSGFFSRAFVERSPKHVIGIDHSQEQIRRAKSIENPLISYRFGDIFKDDFPAADIIVAPFVLNYAHTSSDLHHLIQKIFGALNANGFFIGVVDFPEGRDNSKYGAKKILSQKQDGEKLASELYYEGKKIVTLHAHYYSKETISSLLSKSGFKKISWHLPIISKEGMKRYGEDYWKDYVEYSELGYVVATA